MESWACRSLLEDFLYLLLGRGIDVGEGETASAICAACFQRGVIIETSGAHDEVVKVLAPLTIAQEQLDAGLDILAEAFEETHRSAAAA